MTRSLQADFTLLNGSLVRNVVVTMGADGLINAVQTAEEASSTDLSVERLTGRALLPGFVNAHSHAFQRVLRGRTEHRTPGRVDDDFWSWREAMYTAANRMTPEQIEVVTRFAYLEMLRAGFTHVAEFHYLHHQPDGTPYDDRLELSRRVVRAARTSGIGLFLVPVAYQRGGPDTPASPRQRRFLHSTPDAFLRTFEEARGLLSDGSLPVGLGLAAHSVRALDRPYLEALEGIDTTVHAHINEQPREVEQCLAEHGLRPTELMADVGLLGPQFVGVHATHLSANEIRLLGKTGATVCVCPTTERNLGDGLPPLSELVAAGTGVCVGTDSHVVIDPFAEIAALENGERLRSGRRNALAGEGPDQGVGRALLAAGTSGGASAVAARVGHIRVGHRADLVSIDLSVPGLAGTALGGYGAAYLRDAISLAGTASVVRDVWVGGSQQVIDGMHPGWDRGLAAYQDVLSELAGQAN